MTIRASHPVRRLVHRFDVVCDQAMERTRAHPGADRLFRGASAFGDWSLCWHLVGAARGLGPAPAARQAVQLSAALGLESLVVNQGVKRLFMRRRPVTLADRGEGIRRPVTSSFPSGHASSAAFAATLLGHWSPGGRPVWWSLAALVSISRIHVRLHHASDVIAGAVLGLALGKGAVAVLGRLDRRWPPGATP